MRPSSELASTRVAVIGVGSHYQMQAESHAALPITPIVAVADVQRNVFGEPVSPVATQVRPFVRVVREDVQSALDARDALAVTRIACSIDESARTEQPVNL